MNRPLRGNEPAYASMAATIRADIRTGFRPPGSKLPSERELAEEWGVSRIVARQAVNVLRTEGLVYGVRGKGVFVAEQASLTRIAPDRYRRGRTRTTFVEEASDAGKELNVERAASQIRAPEDLAERLGIETGDRVSDSEYLVTMDGAPVTWSHAYEPLELTGGTEIEWPDEGPYGHLGVVDRFDMIGLHIINVEEVLTVRAPTEVEAGKLQVPSGVGVIELQQTFRTADRAVEVADIIYPANRYRFVYRMPIPGGHD